MLQAHNQLGTADQPAGTAPARLSVLAHCLRATDRAVGRKDEGFRPGRTLVGHHPQDLRDDVAGALQDDSIADPDVLAGDLVLIVQGRVAYHDTADRDRMQTRHGGQGAGAPHLDVDTFEHGLGLLGREFVSDGPARTAGDEAEPRLPVQAVDLIDDAVDVVAEPRPIHLQPGIVGDQTPDPDHPLRTRIDRQAPVSKRRQGLTLGGREICAGFAPGVGEEAQGPLCRDGRVLLSQGAGGEIPRVRIGALAGRIRRPIEGIKGVIGGIDLAANFDDVRPT